MDSILQNVIKIASAVFYLFGIVFVDFSEVGWYNIDIKLKRGIM